TTEVARSSGEIERDEGHLEPLYEEFEEEDDQDASPREDDFVDSDDDDDDDDEEQLDAEDQAAVAQPSTERIKIFLRIRPENMSPNYEISEDNKVLWVKNLSRQISKTA